ncbi:putative SnoaL-like domain-containing protein [Seiridium cardinale]|uniref:SnoaL-like domain-containing protein n=1 Tax=Seiridium cardinale TaxID=138064 RepID=A0ABR2XU05_9PEZI
MSPSRRALLKTTEAFISLFTQPFSDSAAFALRAPDCKHYLGPSTPNLTFTSNKDSVMSWSALQWAFRNYKFTLIDGREPIIDTEARKSVFWVRGTANTADGPYEHDIVFMLTMDEEGDKIQEIVEVCDSAYVAGWMEKFGDDEFRRRSLEWQMKEDVRVSLVGEAGSLV